MKITATLAIAATLALSACASKTKPPGVDMAAISKPLNEQGETLEALRSELQALKGAR